MPSKIVSTLLEILHQVAGALMGFVNTLQFQPFLRFYPAFEIDAVRSYMFEVSTLLEILPAVDTWRSGAGNHLRFQPFLRFYRPAPC